MVALSEIISGVAKAFESTDYRVFDENVQDAQLSQGPIVYVYILSAEETMSGPSLLDRSVRVELSFTDADVVTNQGFYTFVDLANQLLRPVFSFADRHIMPQEVEYKIKEGVGLYTFTLHFLDDEPIPADAFEPDTMETLIYQSSLEK